MTLTRLMRLGIAAGIGAVTVGCSDTFGPPDGLGLAAATNSCGPLGEPAVEIFLASEPIGSFPPDAPYARIYILQSVDELAGETWVLAGGNADGTAWYHSTGTDPEVASSGAVVVNEVDDENNIEGLVDVVFPTAGRIRGEFRAEWVPRNILCL